MMKLLLFAAMLACSAACPVVTPQLDAGQADGGNLNGGDIDAGQRDDAGCPTIDAGVVECSIDAGSSDGGMCGPSRVMTRLRMNDVAQELKGPCTRDDECVILDPFALVCDDGLVLEEICPNGLLASQVCELEARLAPLRAEACDACARFGCVEDDIASECGWSPPHCIDGACYP